MPGLRRGSPLKGLQATIVQLVRIEEMTTRPKKKLKMIRRLEDIPAVMTEAEEHRFWADHELSPELWEQARPFGPDELPPPGPRLYLRSGHGLGFSKMNHS